jgi:hypothetical protein
MRWHPESDHVTVGLTSHLWHWQDVQRSLTEIPKTCRLIGYSSALRRTVGIAAQEAITAAVEFIGGSPASGPAVGSALCLDDHNRNQPIGTQATWLTRVAPHHGPRTIWADTSDE